MLVQIYHLECAPTLDESALPKLLPVRRWIHLWQELVHSHQWMSVVLGSAEDRLLNRYLVQKLDSLHIDMLDMASSNGLMAEDCCSYTLAGRSFEWHSKVRCVPPFQDMHHEEPRFASTQLL